MRKGTQHRPETIEKLRAHWSAVQSDHVKETRVSPTDIDESAVVQWLEGLGDNEFMRFVRAHVVPRVNKRPRE